MIAVEILLLVLIILIAVSGAITIYAGFIAAPFARTPKMAIRKALKIVQLEPGEHFYDIGAGNGTALLMAVREFKAHATGFELSPHHYAVAWLKARISGYGKNEIDLQLKN